MKKEIQELEDQIYIKFEDSQGRLHRHKKPAGFLYQDGKILNIEYRKHGKLHREDGPAQTEFHKDGTIAFQEWWINGQWHRENGPSLINYENRLKKCEYWHKYGKLHREDGPAIILYDKNSNIIAQEYWLDGKEYDILEYYIILDEQKDVK